MSFSIDRHNKRKDILWKKDKKRWEIIKIHAKTAYRRFDTQTKGMGALFIMLFSIMIIINLFPLFMVWIVEHDEKTKYADALKIACTDKSFYSLNFKSCENIEVRP